MNNTVENPLSFMPWVGGKSFRSVPQGPWIASLLPYDPKGVWCEPYGGMLGITLQRPKSFIEILNDRDFEVFNLFRVLRTRKEELEHMLRYSMNNKNEHVFARQLMREHPVAGDDVERAWALVQAVCQSVAKTINDSGFSMHWDSANGVVRRPMSVYADRLEALRARLEQVYFVNRDAIEVLNKLKDVRDAVIYCDPPYPTAREFYGNAALDVGALSEVLMMQRGRVLVSGINDEWEHLVGWERHVCPSSNNGSPGPGAGESFEVVWANYDVHAHQPQQSLWGG